MADRVLIIFLAIALFLIALPKLLGLLGFHPDIKEKIIIFQIRKL